MKGFVEQIRDMDLDKNVKRDMLVIVILKTVYLLELVQANYIQSHGSEYWSEIMLKVCKEMKEIIAFSEISFGIQEIQILHHFIEKNFFNFFKQIPSNLKFYEKILPRIVNPTLFSWFHFRYFTLDITKGQMPDAFIISFNAQ